MKCAFNKLWIFPSRRSFLFGLLLLLVSGCRSVPDTIEPQLNYSVQDRYLKTLPSPFPSITPEEREQDWAKEYYIGIKLAQNLDLYQAIQTFKRAEILGGEDLRLSRKLEIHYEILLCYYVGHKYREVIYAFEHSPLQHADSNFPALHDLLVILTDCYLKEGDLPRSEHMLHLLERDTPSSVETLHLSMALEQGNIPMISYYSQERSYLRSFLSSYEQDKKSPARAQTLSAVLPGAGYLYVGQKQSAVTAFLLNGLFITAAAYFFDQGNIAAGIIFTSFEAGWYFGGIYGAGLEAKYYNERLYERKATPMMNQQKLFPVLMLRYAF